MFDLLAEGNSVAQVAEALGVGKGAVASAKGRYDTETLKLITPDGLADVKGPVVRAKKKVARQRETFRKAKNRPVVIYSQRPPLEAGSPETWGLISSEPYPRNVA
jgi:hypothetical protein